MTLRDMEVFSCAAELGQMSAAAQALFISAPSVSQVVSAMEHECGARLFDRISHRLYLTAAGEEILRYVQEILAARQKLADRLCGFSGGRRILRVGATVTVGACVISGVLRKMRVLDPETEPVVRVANTRVLEELLLSGGLDAALVEGSIQSRSLHVQPALEDRLVLACGRGHEFWGRASVKLSELERQPLILREPGSGTRAQLEEVMASRGLSCRAAWTCCSSESIKTAVADGWGVTVISERLLRRELTAGELWACGLADAQLTRSFDLVWREGKKPDAATAFFIRAAMESEAPSGEA